MKTMKKNFLTSLCLRTFLTSSEPPISVVRQFSPSGIQEWDWTYSNRWKYSTIRWRHGQALKHTTTSGGRRDLSACNLVSSKQYFFSRYRLFAIGLNWKGKTLRENRKLLFGLKTEKSVKKWAAQLIHKLWEPVFKTTALLIEPLLTILCTLPSTRAVLQNSKRYFTTKFKCFLILLKPLRHSFLVT